jgi:hypothetical protein
MSIAISIDYSNILNTWGMKDITLLAVIEVDPYFSFASKPD